MPIFGEKHRFTRRNVEQAPDEPGVYALYADGEVAYYGCTHGQQTIRERLIEEHQAAQGGWNAW